MAKTGVFNMRIDPELKRQAEELYAGFGMNLCDAVTIFLHQSVREGGLPFELKQRPNGKTEEKI